MKKMKIRQRHLDWSWGNVAALTPVLARRFIKNGYSALELCGKPVKVTVSEGFHQQIVWVQ